MKISSLSLLTAALLLAGAVGSKEHAKVEFLNSSKVYPAGVPLADIPANHWVHLQQLIAPTSAFSPSSGPASSSPRTSK